MAFTKALYYPWIDIRDESWLKSAVLYWDQIQTIVPESIEAPYSTDTAKRLQDEGILTPLKVNPRLNGIRSLDVDVRKYLDSREGIEILDAQANNSSRLSKKIERKLQPLLSEEPISHIHMKMEPSVTDLLIRHGLAYPKSQSDGFISIDNRFASFYMTLLATRLSEAIGSGLLTSSPKPHRLNSRVQSDDQLCDVNDDKPQTLSERLTQGMLVELMIEKITIDPETPIEKIITYRKEHSSELGRFRKKVEELSKSLPDELHLPAAKQALNDIYDNEVTPAMDDLKNSLRGKRINWITDSWISLAFFSVCSSSLLNITGLNSTYALLVGAGVSMTGACIKYSIDRKSYVQTNPFSYLMEIEKGFGR